MKKFNLGQYAVTLKKWRLGSLEEMLYAIGMVAIGFMMLFTTVDIIGRYLFNSPLPGNVEILAMVMALAIFVSLPGSQREGVHVGADFLIERLKGRAYHYFRIFDLLMPLMIFGLITYYSWGVAVNSYRSGDVTMGIMEVPTAPFRFVSTFGCFLLCIRFIIQLRGQVLAMANRAKGKVAGIARDEA